MQNEAAILLPISLYSIKIIYLVRSLQYSFHFYQEITEIVMTEFIAWLLQFPAELACSLKVIIQFLQNSMWYFIFSNHYLAFFFLTLKVKPIKTKFMRSV